MVITRSGVIKMKPTWQKVLYKDQGVPDNYTDETFLEDLRKNVNTRTYEYWHVVYESLVVTGQMCSVCLFVIIYIHMSWDTLSPLLLLSFIGISTTIGYMCNYAMKKSELQPENSQIFTDNNSEYNTKSSVVGNEVSSLFIFICFGWFLSPILHSLTDTISTDTIYAMATLMLLANLIFHDYGMQAAIVSRAISLNTVIFAAVCLSSRLPTSLHTYALICLVVEVFGLWPILRHKIKESNALFHTCTSVILVATTLYSLHVISNVCASLFLLILTLTTCLCPACLLLLQPLKDTVHGPWDEVQPEITS